MAPELATPSSEIDLRDSCVLDGAFFVNLQFGENSIRDSRIAKLTMVGNYTISAVLHASWSFEPTLYEDLA